MTQITQLTVGDGKYTLVMDPGNLRALRHGEPWRDLVGDGFVMALGHEIEELRVAEVALETALDLALEILSRQEPCDSRAVSNEFVTMAAIRAGDRSPEMVDFALKAKERIAALPPLPPAEIFVTYGSTSSVTA